MSAEFWPAGDPWSFLWHFRDRIPAKAKILFLPDCRTEVIDCRNQHIQFFPTSGARAVFIDLDPSANWAHPVAYAIRNDDDGQVLWLTHNLPPLSTASAIELVRLDNRFGVR